MKASVEGVGVDEWEWTGGGWWRVRRGKPDEPWAGWKRSWGWWGLGKVMAEGQQSRGGWRNAAHTS